MLSAEWSKAPDASSSMTNRPDLPQSIPRFRGPRVRAARIASGSLVESRVQRPYGCLPRVPSHGWPGRCAPAHRGRPGWSTVNTNAPWSCWSRVAHMTVSAHLTVPPSGLRRGSCIVRQVPGLLQAGSAEERDAVAWAGADVGWEAVAADDGSGWVRPGARAGPGPGVIIVEGSSLGKPGKRPLYVVCPGSGGRRLGRQHQCWRPNRQRDQTAACPTVPPTSSGGQSDVSASTSLVT